MLSNEVREKIVDLNAEVLDLTEKYSGDNLSENLLWLYSLDVIEDIIRGREKLVGDYVELLREESEEGLLIISLWFQSSYVKLREVKWKDDILTQDNSANFNYSENELLNKLKDLVFDYEKVYQLMLKHKANKFLEDVLYTLGQIPF